MSDSKNLYFIPIIAEALEKEDSEEALRTAFHEILKLGKTPEYKAGFEQFLELINYSLKYFMEDLEGSVESLISSFYHLMYDLASGKVVGAINDSESMSSILKEHPEWKKEFDRIQQFVHKFSDSVLGIEIEILRDNQMIGTFPASQLSASFSRVIPGLYTIRLSNGTIV